MSNGNIAVKGLARRDIRKLTQHVRQITQVSQYKKFCVVHWFEDRFCDLMGFTYDICEAQDMGDNHALTRHENKHIYIREDIYNRARQGHGRDRATVIHEVGHALMHTPDRVVYARNFQEAEIPTYAQPEWQAKVFAGEFLAPVSLMELGMCAADVADQFGISHDAALVQMGAYVKEGLMMLNGPARRGADPQIIWMKS